MKICGKSKVGKGSFSISRVGIIDEQAENFSESMNKGVWEEKQGRREDEKESVT